MLLIPDIHINSQYRDQIIQSLSDIVDTHPHEDHIVLLGDYVYMFSYDRGALLALYTLLIGRYHAGKTVYVLAGNHDRHGQHFVYEEAKQAWDIINSSQGSTTSPSQGAIHFIVTPQIFHIENEAVLMMPYMIDWSTVQYQLGSDTSTSSLGQAHLRKTLTQSSNKYDQASGRLNLIMAYYTQHHQVDTIIHHYYIANTQFPGLRAQFGYRQVALDPYWMNAGYDVISGHIHHPLFYGRYLCCGSLWTTAANETNQFKYYWTKHGLDVEGYQLQINPHITLTYDGSPLDLDHLQQHRDTLTQEHLQQLKSDHYHITLHHTPLQSNLTSINIITNHHTDIEQLSDPTLLGSTKSIKPKYKAVINHDHTTITIDTEQLSTSIVQRQEMLTDYIASKYHDQQSVYLDLLDELHIIDKK